MIPFKEKSWPAYFFSLCLLGGFTLWNSVRDHHSDVESSLSLASKEPESFETINACGGERTYLLRGIEALPWELKGARKEVGGVGLPRSCVTYIMNNFIDARSVKSSSYGYCGPTSGEPIRGADGKGMHMPCVTEAYVNSVHNALVDVSDCLNIPIKELMPKLANESGLHVNTLGPDADGGVGQLTRSALAESYMRWDGEDVGPSTLDVYINEMKKSPKKSCQRIVAQKSAYRVAVPAGKKLCYLNENRSDCFKPWMVQSRCEFMTTPNNPLRNILFTGIFYRSLLRSATGINYGKGEDTLWGQSGLVQFTPDMNYGGFIGKKKIVDRLYRLGISRPSQEVLRQMVVSFAFNGGIGTAQSLLDNYIKLREEHRLPLKAEDLDFINVSIAPWSVVTNPVTFLNMLANPNEEEFGKSLERLRGISRLGLDSKKYEERVFALRKVVRSKVAPFEVEGKEAEFKAKKVSFIDQSEEIRREVLNDVFDRSHMLTLPEFMRIGHAWTIAFKKGGGAPGYLSFLAAKHKELETQMGVGTCTVEQYLHF